MSDLSYVDVQDLLTVLDVKGISRSGAELDFVCPFHDDSSPSARMNSRSTAWICHGCGAKGNAIDFVSRMRSVSRADAKTSLENRYGGNEVGTSIGSLEEEVLRIMSGPLAQERRIPPTDEWIPFFGVDWVGLSNDLVSSNEWYDQRVPIDVYRYIVTQRGFSPATLAEWKVGYDELAARLAIPVHDVDGVLVGFKGRAYRPEHQPRYLILGDAPEREVRYGFQTYHKSQHVFALDRADTQASDGEIVIVEGELNAIAMHSYGFTNAVAVAGKDFSQRQRELIVSRAQSAIIYFDDDDAGHKGTQKVIEELETFMPLKVVVEPPSDAADLDAETVGDLLDEAVPSLVLHVQGYNTSSSTDRVPTVAAEATGNNDRED